MARKRTRNDRSGTNATTAVAPSVTDDLVEVEAKTIVHPDDEDAAAPGDDDTNAWDDLRRSLTGELLPLTSPSSGYASLAKLVLSDEIDVDDEERVQMRRRLTSTSVKLFRHIERLASMENGLTRALERRREQREMGNGYDDEEEEEGEEDEDEEECCVLSGIPTLYVGDDLNNLADIETIWGQVDMQNDALISMLKKRVKKLARRCDNGDGGMKEGRDEDETVRILRTTGGGGSDEDVDAMGEENDDDLEDDDYDNEEEENDEDEEGGEEGGGGESSDDDEDDEGRRRIRERMRRAMADMYGDEDGVHDDEYDDDDRKIDVTLKKTSSSSGEASDDDDAADAAVDNDDDGNEGVDPTREEMLDGFFDLHEMEAFADEEEEMLPDEAFGEEEDDVDDDDGGGGEKKKKGSRGKLPHLRERLGDGSESDDDGDGNADEREDDDDVDGDLLAKRYRPTTVRRKKYRPDDEVEALYKMYEGGEKNGGGFGDDEEAAVADASTMTAADFFGEPSKKLIKKYKAEMNAKVKNGGMKGRGGGNVEKAKGKSFADENDEDSWDDHNFGEDGMDWRNDDENGEEGVDDDDDDGIKNSRKGDRNDNSDDDYEEEMNDEDGKDGIDRVDQRKLSAHEIRSQKLQQQTLRLEEDMMAEKPWRMMGEARGTNRATDSLLDSTPEFEVAFKPPPILTPQHAADIEAMIKKRIIDEDWDDVIPRELPDIGAHKRGGGDAPEVSQEKSKLGLGELYEREYLKKTAGYDRDAHEKQTEEDAAKEEMKRLFANLCSQLDALSNYHFAPRPVADEVEVQNREDVPAIAMEEVLPLHVSRSRGIAPEEVHAAGKGRKSVLKGESELDQAERKRLRNAKKAARRKSRQQKHADERLISKLQPGLGLNNPYEKRKLREELQMARASGKVVVAAENGGQWKDEAASGKEYQTSTKFFAKMQENVDSMIHGDDGVGNGRAKKKRKGLEAGHASSVYRL